MPPVYDYYAVASGQDIHGGHGLQVGLPAWLQAISVGELASISGTAPSAAARLVPSVAGSMGNQSRITDGWCGAFLHRTRLCIHGGGHGDYGGNEIPGIDLLDDSPVWDLLIERTPVADLLGGSNYYADGMPTSRHTYYGMFVAQVGGIDKMLRFNANMGFAYNGVPVGGAADIRTLDIDAFNLVTNAWEPAAYGPMPRITGSETAMAQHPVTGNIYVWDTSQRISIYDVSSDTATDLADLAGTEGQGAALVVDAVNGRLVRFAGRASGGVVYYPLAGGSKTTPTLTGPGASALTAALSGERQGWGRAHDTARNHVYLYTNLGAIFRVDLANWIVTEITPTGESLNTPTNAWWGRVQYVPSLDIVVSLANWTSEIQVYKVA